MSTLTSTPSHRIDALHPFTAAATAAVVYTVAFISGDVFDLNTDTDEGPATTLGEVAIYTGLVLLAVLVAVWLGRRARAGSPGRLSVTALGLAIASAATVVVFWSGWPLVYGAVAAALALEHRRRVGSFSLQAALALLIGALAFVAGAALCVLG